MEPLQALTEANARDLVRAFKLHRLGPMSKALERAARWQAKPFSREILEFDDVVGQNGLIAGAEFLLQRHTEGSTSRGAAPKEGPLIVVSNHPGMSDAMAVWKAVGREDLKTVAADRDLLRCLKNVSGRLITIHEDRPTTSTKETLRWLRSGGAVLTFPAGKIEPDPAIYADEAKETRGNWPDPAKRLRRSVPGLRVVEARVSGVISTSARRHPLARMFRSQADRDWAAATLQIAFKGLRDVRPEVELIDLG